MMCQTKFLSYIILLFAVLTNAYQYKYLSYDDIIENIQDLKSRYPNYIKVAEATQENKYIVKTNCGNKPCQHYYLKIADFGQPEEVVNSLPQVFLMGSLHGNERLGANILMYLAEYLLTMNLENGFVTQLLKNRMTIILPMANPHGYYYNKRDEENEFGNIFDPNRDFPYNVEEKNCLNTAASRVVHHIYQTHLIRSAITFHGGETSITYPWGSGNHKKDSKHGSESPDNFAFEKIAEVLQREAGANPAFFMHKYNIGKMTDVVYDVNGGMEDWSYAASWERDLSPEVITNCNSSVQPIIPRSELNYSKDAVKCATFLIETADSKAPAEEFLGSSEGITDFTKESYGHVTRNIKIALTLIDLAAPYIRDYKAYSPDGKKMVAEWKAGGCIDVTETFCEYQLFDSATGNPNTNLTRCDIFHGPGYWTNANKVYNAVIPLESNTSYATINIKLQCDQNWKQQDKPEPAVKPQTLLVGPRIDPNYQARNKNYTAKSHQQVSISLSNVTLRGIYQDENSAVSLVILLAQFVKCLDKDHTVIGETRVSIKQDSMGLFMIFNGEVQLNNPYLEGFLYENGDYTYCDDSIGNPVQLPANVFSSSTAPGKLFDIIMQERKKAYIFNRFEVSTQDLIHQFIGRTIAIKSKNDHKLELIGSLVPIQPASCTESLVGCLGFPIEKGQVSCGFVERNIRQTSILKLVVSVDEASNTTHITGVVSQFFYDKFLRFEHLELKNSQQTLNLKLGKAITSTLYELEDIPFFLNASNVLGNLIHINAVNKSSVLPVGTCQFVHHNLDDVTYLLKQASEPSTHAQSQEEDTDLVYIIVGCAALLVLVVVAAKFLKDYYKKMKSKLLKTVMKSDMARSYSPRGRDGITINSERKDLVSTDRKDLLAINMKSSDRYTKFENNNLILEELELDEKDNPPDAPRRPINTGNDENL